MIVLEARNAQQALGLGINYLTHFGHNRSSRNGAVLVANGPVTTVYKHPTERVVSWPLRDANPFFHLYEALWMLAGRSDVEGPATYAKQIKSYSDDGETLHGAYGHRWRAWFGFDQLSKIVSILAKNPDDRRAVLGMWSPQDDLGREGKDVPCNTHIYFSVSPLGDLDMTVCCRSNDIIWGAYGANAVHFSVLQEYVAGALGLPVGRYWQISNNYHGYLETLKPLLGEVVTPSLYENSLVPMPMGVTPKTKHEFLEDVSLLLNENVTIGLRSQWLRQVAVPVLRAHQHYRENKGVERYEGAVEILMQCKSRDWLLAGVEWINRRKDKFLNEPR